MAARKLIPLVFWAPSRAFATLAESPVAWLAVLVLMATAMGSHATVSARIDRDAMQRATAQKLAFSSKGKDVSEREIEKETTLALNMQRISGYARVLVSVPVMVLAIALLFWLVGRFSRPRVRLRVCWAVAAHVWLPLGLRHLLSLPVILQYPGLDPDHTSGLFRTDLGSLLGHPVPGAAWLDPFWIWMGVLVVLAGRVAGFKRWQGILGGVLAWLLLGLLGRVVA